MSREPRPARSPSPAVALLAQAARTLGTTLELGRLVERLTEIARAHIAADAAGVWLLERGGAELVLRGDVGFKRPEMVARLAQPPGRDVLGWIADRPGPLVLRRLPVEARPEVRRWVEGEEVRSFLGVPLLGDTAPVGALGLFRRNRRAFTRADLARAETLCIPAAPAILNARLYAEQLGRAEELAALLRAVRTVMGGLDTRALLDSIVREAAAIAGTPHVKLLLLDRESSALHVAAQVGHPIPADVAVPLGESYSGRVALTGDPVFIADTDELASHMAARDGESGLVTYLGLPVKIRDTALGVLTFHTEAPRRYSTDELAYLGSFADQAAIALHNAHLYEDTQRALSDLRTMQRTLVQGETLRALGELAGGAAHHLNNLLTIVVGRIQLLRRMVEEERLARPLEIIERAAKDGAEVVRRLQQFAGMRRTAEPRTVDLGQIVTDVLEMTRGRWQDAARARGTEIVVESRLTPLPPMPGDAAALREMLTNLVLNAVDALPRGGRLTVEVGPSEGAATLAVTDTGLGMPDEVRLRAHEPFFTTKGVRATGLGLSVAFGIARRHGGELSIQSEEGRGTTVRVTLPLPAATTAPAHPPAALPRRALRVLLVDDEEEVRIALAQMLANRGHTVLEAGGGVEALHRLEEERDLDLVLTDLVMPAMTGWELASAVKARRPGLPVGVVTGWGDVPEATPGSRTAVDFVLFKPVTFEALDQALGRV